MNEYFAILLQNFRHCVRVGYVRTLAMNIAVASHSSTVSTIFSDRMHMPEWGKKMSKFVTNKVRILLV